MKRIGMPERRARLGVRHILARPAASVEDATAAMVGLHSSDPGTVYLSAWARVGGFAAAQLEDALYERRSLVRMLGMRKTLFVVPREVAAAMDEACTRALAPPERTRLIRMLEGQGVAKDGARWLDRVGADVLRSLDARGQATARELTEDVPELGTKLRFGEGRSWGGVVGVSTRVLFLLAADGEVVRGRPLGTWISGQYRWARTRTWLGEPLATIEHDEACADLLRRYLAAFGPATTTDIRWWTGWTARLTTKTLKVIEAVEIELEQGTGYVLPDDREPADEPEPWVALLPSLDPTTMGWKDRAWYLGEQGAALFDRNGNAGPTVWADGRVVGGWAQAEDGEIRLGLLESLDARTRSAIDVERERLRTWLGEVRIKPRFRVPSART